MEPDTSFLDGLLLAENEKIAVLGIGNELNGDDAAGPLAARGLIAALEQAEAPGEIKKDAQRASFFNDRVLIIEAGPAPEAFTGPLRRFAPGLVLLIDAAELGQAPGTIRWFDWSAVEGMSASTHTLPPSVLAQFLTTQLGCRVALIGIQPKGLEFDQPVSLEVQAAVKKVVEEVAHRLMNGG